MVFRAILRKNSTCDYLKISALDIVHIKHRDKSNESIFQKKHFLANGAKNGTFGAPMPRMRFFQES